MVHLIVRRFRKNILWNRRGVRGSLLLEQIQQARIIRFVYIVQRVGIAGMEGLSHLVCLTIVHPLPDLPGNLIMQLIRHKKTPLLYSLPCWKG